MEVQQLSSTVSDLKQQIDAAAHGHRVIDTAARARQEKLAMLGEIKEALALRATDTRARVSALQKALSCLLGDSLRAAAMCVLAGMLSPTAQHKFQQDVQQALREGNVPHTVDLTLPQWMEFLEQQYILLPERVLMDEGLQHTMYCLSMVRDHPGSSSAGGDLCRSGLLAGNSYVRRTQTHPLKHSTETCSR